MLISPQNLLSRLTEVRSRIISAAVGAGRDPAGITLVAVTKTKPAALIRAAAVQGVTDFGENYLQEALGKMAELNDLALTWHFIGALQSNKTRPVAQNFAWVHGVDRLKIAQRLSEHRPFHAPPLNVCIQVELEPEPGKAGVAPAEVAALATQMAGLPRLNLRGLMCIPPPVQDPQRQLGYFEHMARLLRQLNEQGHRLDTLSMGMSEDFEMAVRAGATMVRVGSAIFGAR
jgi:pyridoxal phosphate enzyme (YggS family)